MIFAVFAGVRRLRAGLQTGLRTYLQVPSRFHMRLAYQVISL